MSGSACCGDPQPHGRTSTSPSFPGSATSPAGSAPSWVRSVGPTPPGNACHWSSGCAGTGTPSSTSGSPTKRRLLHARIAEVFQAETRAAGIELSGADAHTLALAVVALSNGLGFESIIDADAVPPDLLGELFSRLVGGMLAQSGPDGDPTAET